MSPKAQNWFYNDLRNLIVYDLNKKTKMSDKHDFGSSCDEILLLLVVLGVGL